ncbi:hypothetical protein QTH97_31150 [Variovorax sp. J22R24]|uniref:hypothetical protein n=1 Tax=Variovorax gracilis TaxID=3053502 RepID=UPI002578FF2D|nr:hypothetical protein [Variovorax sp. J22R24]MDM0109419.1 hypothetical protein [Variovorax sp. J22R24]
MNPATPFPADSATVVGLLELLNAGSKREAQKITRDLVITSGGFASFLLAAQVGTMAPYIYTSHFQEVQPESLRPSEADLKSMGSNGVGPLKPEAAKGFRKVSQMMIDRRLFAAHLLYAPDWSRWHLFYFDQRDTSERGNHWTAGGPHIHYARETDTQMSANDMWRAVQATPPNPPRGTHVRYEAGRPPGNR